MIPEALESASPGLLKRRISLELRQRREAAGLKQKDAARRLDRTQQHITNIETATNLPSTGDMELLLELYGVPERIEFMRELLVAAKKGQSWWKAFSGAVPDWFDLYLGLESGAAEISTFEAYLMPGLLQTPAYAEAVIRSNPDLTDDQVQRIVKVRLARQGILDRPDPVRLWVLIDELVLYRRRGTREVMAEQIDQLIELSKRPRIDLQILPRDAPAQHGGSFSFLKFPPEWCDPGVVYEDALVGGRYHEAPEKIALYDRAINRMHGLAATPEDSRTILQRARKEV